jgi:hypothetical protein
MSENRVLRVIFGPKRDEVTDDCIRIHEELYDLYCSPNIIQVIRWARRVPLTGKRRVAYTDLVGNPRGKRPLGRPRLRWEDNIEIDLQEAAFRR